MKPLFHRILERIKNEPALFMAFVGQVVAALVVFGVGLTPEQIITLEGLVAAAVSVLIRRKVTPTRKLEP